MSHARLSDALDRSSQFALAAEQVILDTTIKSVNSFDILGRGRLALAVVDAPHIPFTVAVSRRGARLLVDGVQIEGFEVPHVSGAADALGSFGMFEAAMPSAVKEGARVTIVLPGETAANSPAAGADRAYG